MGSINEEKDALCQTDDQETANCGPRKGGSFVFCRGKLPGALTQLEMDLRKLMLPYTALKLKEKKRNNIKDLLNVAGPMGFTHFLILLKTESSPYLRVARTPQGPTLTFKIHEYSLASDIIQSQLRPRSLKDLFKNPPLNIFPATDINTVRLRTKCLAPLTTQA